VIAGLDAYSEQDGLTSDAGFDAGRPSADTGAGTSSVDSSVLPVDSGGPGVIIDDGGNTLDAGHDTGPPQMNCTLSQNGQGCGFDAASCCSGNCDETHTCSAYRGKDLTQGCSNDSPPSYSLITDRVRMADREQLDQR
jgi:hypothetical protein